MSKHHQKLRPMYPRENIREQALVAQRDDLEGQLDTALKLLRDRDDHGATIVRLRKSISDLKNRLKLSTEANHTLRIDNARLLALGQRGVGA